jgi:hypothetical protein
MEGLGKTSFTLKFGWMRMDELVVLFLGEKFQFRCKNTISTYTKDFPWKKWPKFARFQKK